jgi:excisionase family DNA binding protein
MATESAEATRQELITGSAVARRLGVSREYVNILVREGTLTPVRLRANGWPRFRTDEVEALIRGEAP